MIVMHTDTIIITRYEQSQIHVYLYLIRCRYLSHLGLLLSAAGLDLENTSVTVLTQGLLPRHFDQPQATSVGPGLQ